MERAGVLLGRFTTREWEWCRDGCAVGHVHLYRCSRICPVYTLSTVALQAHREGCELFFLDHTGERVRAGAHA